MQNITVEHDGPDLRVEMTLSSSVTPSVHSATHPDRILLDFPGITYVEKAKKFDVQSNGVTEIQAVQYASNPLITRVVVELDQPHIYKLKAEGNRVIFTVSVAAVAEKSHGGAPAAAASGSLAGDLPPPEGISRSDRKQFINPRVAGSTI